jgi:hypothetical protein
MVFIHGGLRGAVGLAFAMLANADEALTPALRDIVYFIIIILYFKNSFYLTFLEFVYLH